MLDKVLVEVKVLATSSSDKNLAFVLQLGRVRNQDTNTDLNMNFIFYFGKAMTLVEDNNILNTVLIS